MLNFIPSLLKSILTSEAALVVAIVAIFIVLWFMYRQVYNHIPTQIKEVKQDINRVEDKMDSQYKELNNKMDSQYKELNNKMDKLLYYLIDNTGKK